MSINADTILTICSIITSVAGACAVITSVIKKQLAKLTDKVKEETIKEINNDIIKPLMEDTNTKINNIIEKLDSLDELNESNSEKSNAFKVCTLKGLIIQAHGTYMQLGHISTYVIAELEEIFRVYHDDLHGNHFVTNLMEDLRSLQKVDNLQNKN